MAIHAGLETGLISGKYPDMDIIAYGCYLLTPHSPLERMEIESVGRCYKFTLKLLERIAGL